MTAPPATAREPVADFAGVFDLNTGEWRQYSSHLWKANFPGAIEPFTVSRQPIPTLDAEYQRMLEQRATFQQQQQQQQEAASPPPLRIVHLSDTHCFHSQIALPRGDVLVFTGDALYCSYAQTHELNQRRLADFRHWLCDSAATSHFALKIFTFGNHDLAMPVRDIRRMFAPAVFLDATQIVEFGGVRFAGHSWSAPTGSQNRAYQQVELRDALAFLPSDHYFSARVERVAADAHRHHPAAAAGGGAAATVAGGGRGGNKAAAAAAAHREQRTDSGASSPAAQQRLVLTRHANTTRVREQDLVDVMLCHSVDKRKATLYRHLSPALIMGGHLHWQRSLVCEIPRRLLRFPKVADPPPAQQQQANQQQGLTVSQHCFQYHIPFVNASNLAEMKRDGSAVLFPAICFDVCPLPQ